MDIAARNVRVFGSTARGDADSNSDVDLLVDLEPGRSLFDLGGMLLELTEMLGRPVDLKTPGFIAERILRQVPQEAEVQYAA